jgi:hypothetical protein
MIKDSVVRGIPRLDKRPIEILKRKSKEFRVRKSFVALMAVLAAASISCSNALARSPQASEQTNRHSVTAAGSHDLSGVWLFDEKRYHDDPVLYLLPAKEVPPMTPWGQEKFDEAKPGTRGGTGDSDNDPTFRCDPPGLPRITNGREGPFEIIQVPGRILILYESFLTRRQVWMDGRALPSDPDPTWYGYSVGKWDGDTLVVDTVGFNDKSWLDGAGHPHSDAMHIEERYRRVDHDTLEMTMKIDDPKAYRKPWVGAEPKIFKLRPKLELMELPCVPENEEKFLKTVREPAALTPSK